MGAGRRSRARSTTSRACAPLDAPGRFIRTVGRQVSRVRGRESAATRASCIFHSGKENNRASFLSVIESNVPRSSALHVAISRAVLIQCTGESLAGSVALNRLLRQRQQTRSYPVTGVSDDGYLTRVPFKTREEKQSNFRPPTRHAGKTTSG